MSNTRSLPKGRAACLAMRLMMGLGVGLAAGLPATAWAQAADAGAAPSQSAALRATADAARAALERAAAGVKDAARDAAAVSLEAAGRALSRVGAGTPRELPPPVQPPADGSIDPAQPLTLLQAWRAAAANDPTLRAARATAAAGRERLPQAQAQLRPGVALSASRFRNENDRDSLNVLGQQQTSTDRYFSDNETLSLRQPLFRPQQMAQLRQARHLAAEADAQLEREVQNLAVRLSGSYLEAMLARDQQALVGVQRAFLLTQLDAARKSFEGGAGTRTDIDETQARLDLNGAQQLEARQQVALTRRQLQALVQRPFGELATFNAASLDLAAPEPDAVDAWVARTEAASPEIRALSLQLSAAREEIARARAGHLPTLDLVAQLQRSRSENTSAPQTGYRNASLGLQLSLPLYSGGYVSSIERQAAAEHERLLEQIEAARLDLGVRVHREFRGVTEGIARVRALQVALNSSEVALDSARKSFAAGTRTALDILNAEQQRAQVLRDLAQARYQTLSARVRLHALAGAVDETLMTRLSAAFAP